MKIVLDTNVLISAIFWKGKPHEILTLAEKGIFRIASSNAILEELFGVLERPKFKPYLQQAQATMPDIQEKVLSLVEIFVSPNEVSVIQDDPSDNRILECALASRAFCIVSGDLHLVHLKQFREIPILTPSQFLSTLKSKKPLLTQPRLE